MEILRRVPVAALPLAVLVTKVVDTIRDLFGDKEANVPKVVWNILALVVECRHRL